MLDGLTRAERRILVVLLTGAKNLSGRRIKDLAQVHHYQTTMFLSRLERLKLVTTTWDVAEYWSLTDFGRIRVAEALQLEHK